MNDLFALVLREGAEELRLCADECPLMIVQGTRRAIDASSLSRDDVAALLGSIATEDQLKELHACGDIHFIYVFQNASRFAVIAKAQHEAFSLKARNIGFL